MKSATLVAFVVLACQFSTSFALNSEDLKTATSLLAKQFEILAPILKGDNSGTKISLELKSPIWYPMVNTPNAAQAIAEHEAFNCDGPATKPIVLYNFMEKTIVLKTTAVDLKGKTKFEALKASLDNDGEFLSSWFKDTKVTSLGVALKVFCPKAADTTKQIFYQFIFTTKNSSEKEILQKGQKEFRAEMVIIHTDLRKRHLTDSVPLTLIDDSVEKAKPGIAKGAKDYAEYLAANGTDGHSPDAKKCGENLAFQYNSGAVWFGASAAEFGCHGWYDEINLYAVDVLCPEMLEHFGHFTQMIWKATTEFNPYAAYGIKEVNGKPYNYLVVAARYYEKGNMFGINYDPQNFLDNAVLLYEP